MKKYIIITLIAAALLAVSCTSDGLPEYSYSGTQDTVITLNTPSVSAVAYPGYNLVSWQPVPDNMGYEVYRYEGVGSTNWTDKAIEKKDAGSTTYYEDTDIQNGVTYRYEIIALGSIGGRGVETRDSAVGSATCVGILPPLDTSALNLAAYEGGYTDGKNDDEEETNKKEIKEGSDAEKYYLSSDNIYAYIDSGKTKNDLGRFAARFPAKAYLEYSMVASKGDYYEKSYLYTDDFGDAVSTIANNTFLTITNLDDTGVGITTSGEYTVYIKAKAKNLWFANYDIVKCDKKITVDELVTKDAPSFKSVAYTDPADTTEITIKINVLKLDNGNIVPASYMKLYKAVKDTKKYVAVDAAVTLNDDNLLDMYYEATETVSDVEETTTYEYILVVTDGKKYCKSTANKDMTYITP